MTLKKAEGEEDLSSDDEDELLYTKAFDDDADMHGTGYARYWGSGYARYLGSRYARYLGSGYAINYAI